MSPEELVRQVYESYQARDYLRAAEVLHERAELQMPATGERLVGAERILAFQRDYPEPWGELRVLRTAANAAGDAVAETEIVGPDDVFRCAAFWTLHEGLLRQGVEYWVTVGGDQPPERRAGAQPRTATTS